MLRSLLCRVANSKMYLRSTGATAIRRQFVTSPNINAASGPELVNTWTKLQSLSTDQVMSLRPDELMWPPVEQNPREIFVNRSVNLSNLRVIGFDYDYTLVSYTNELQRLIHKIACQRLVEVLRYPGEMQHCLAFDPNFAIRGLMFDTNTGLMVKVDSSLNISLDCAFRGRTRLSEEQVVAAYNGDTKFTKTYRDQHMRSILDLFSLAEACLLCDVLEYFEQNGIRYSPAAVFADVSAAIEHAHVSGAMHGAVMADVEKYIHKSTHMIDLLKRMRDHGKKTFLLSNSSIEYVDAGMRYIIGEDWMQSFDLVLTSARKPSFYTSSRPFREVRTTEHNTIERRYPGARFDQKWTQVEQLQQGRVYSGGNLKDLMRMTGWKGKEVLYMGDHVFADLVEPARKLGWWTGAIIREIESEVTHERTRKYQALNVRLQVLEELMRKIQWASWPGDSPQKHYKLSLGNSKTRIEKSSNNITVDAVEYIDVTSSSVINSSVENSSVINSDFENEVNSEEAVTRCSGLERALDVFERDRRDIRWKMHRMMNIYFGSVFRTQHSSSLFANSMTQYVDLYTSRLDNFLHYSMNHRFYPATRGLPHETAPRQGLVRDITNILQQDGDGADDLK